MRYKPMIKEEDVTRDLSCGEVIPSLPMTPENSMKKCGTQRSQRWRPLYWYERLLMSLGFKIKNLEWLEDDLEEQLNEINSKNSATAKTNRD